MFQLLLVNWLVRLWRVSLARYQGIETEYMDVDTVIVSDNDMQIDDVMITGVRPEAAVGPAIPTVAPVQVPVCHAKSVPPHRTASASTKATVTAMTITHIVLIMIMGTPQPRVLQFLGQVGA